MQPDQTRHGPAALERNEAAKPNITSPNSITSSNPIGLILSRLDRVRQYGNAYRADCPVGHSSKGTLSVATGDDGRVLLTCFACGDIGPVLDALGLQLGDLFPARIRDQSPAGRKERREALGMAGWRAALGVLAPEATICEVALTMIERGEPLTPDDIERTRLAIARVHHAREVLI